MDGNQFSQVTCGVLRVLVQNTVMNPAPQLRGPADWTVPSRGLHTRDLQVSMGQGRRFRSSWYEGSAVDSVPVR